MLDDGDLINFSDLVKTRVEDADGRHVGHVQDMALGLDLSSPFIDALGIHMLWTDRVGGITLVRRVEDLVALVGWTHVASVDEDLVTVRGRHPDFPLLSAEGKLLVRRDILNKQMVDLTGNRVQRVDDVLLVVDGERLKIAGLDVSKSLLLASSTLRHYLADVRRKYASVYDPEVIPWDAVRSIEEGAVVINQHVRR
ncbi:MAG: hypothetical protein CVT63_00260 [Candidatus Anoxymicrobium japonicum]|uniref:PRC-barrel domain-containing protein n=1 Tax=Candidatus Anoxymicrobium japonicum TaxID=2013648 RepID=A0A2N3G869_9ACTN|nr:MAG: hypothetical protein CVT63_00260 [Candidatus Anoxymicrobium japonicum]